MKSKIKHIYYFIISIIGSLADFACLFAFVQVLSLNIWISIIMAYMIGVYVIYELNLIYVFEGKKTKTLYMQYLVSGGAISIISATIISIASDYGINIYLGKLMLIPLFYVVNYKVRKYYAIKSFNNDSVL